MKTRWLYVWDVDKVGSKDEGKVLIGLNERQSAFIDAFVMWKDEIKACQVTGTTPAEIEQWMRWKEFVKLIEMRKHEEAVKNVLGKEYYDSVLFRILNDEKISDNRANILLRTLKIGYTCMKLFDAPGLEDKFQFLTKGDTKKLIEAEELPKVEDDAQ